MELKKKFQILFNKRESILGSRGDPGESSGIGEIRLPDLPHRISAADFPDEEVTRYPTDPREDQEILEEIDAHFYEEDFDSSLFQLKKLPMVLDQNIINGDRQRLLRQLTVVTKRVFAQILSQQRLCNSEMERIQEIREKLSTCLDVCREGRNGLAKARIEFTASSLGILAAYRRRQQTIKLLHDLDIIRTLQRTDVRLQELLKENDYPGAIQLLLECQKVALAYKQFTSISQLSAKLQDTLEMTEEALDVALSKVCIEFNPTLYGRLHRAYSLLGKTQTSMDQLHMHLTSAIHNTAWKVIYEHAKLQTEPSIENSSENGEDALAKKPYADLCGVFSGSSRVLPCLIDLCSALWNIMASYKRIYQWHQDQEDFLDPIEDEYVRRKLENGLPRVWQDVQTKVKIFVLANDLAVLSIDSFLQFMDVIHKLIEVGHAFCGSASDTLQESLKKQCWNYFQSYHLTRLEELRMHLDNEGWAFCPVKPSFKATHLSEFRHLKDVGFGSPMKKPRNKSTNIMTTCPFDSDQADETLAEEDFLIPIEKEEGFYYSDSEDEDIPEELKRDSVDENCESLPPASKKYSLRLKRDVDSPIVTNTTLMILRLCGKYLRLMKMLDTIAIDIFGSLAQLIEYYVFSVHSFFTVDLADSDKPFVHSYELSSRLNRIQDQLIKQQSISSSSSSSNQHLDNSINGIKSGLVSLPVLSPHVLENLGVPDLLFGLIERFIGVESAIFLANQIQELRPSIEKLVPRENLDSIAEFFSQSIDFVEELRRPVYMPVASRVINTEVILQLMSKVAWDVKEVKSQHSQYVDVLLRELQVFSIRVGELRQHKIEIPINVVKLIWDLCIHTASITFVEGFSSAKKCSNEGRALMQLDYRQFVMKLEKIAEIKPIPYQDYVSQYIKAYYIPELDLEDWVQQHTEYSQKQLVALVNCVAYNNNKTKQRLNTLISELSGRIRR